jgi:NAD(P)-dependent dehydrogenase (short-subunit alcohol dehydrogenase family)
VRLTKNAEAEKQIKAGLVSGVPMGRMGTSDEIARGVSFLATDASYIARIELFVDGGYAQV